MLLGGSIEMGVVGSKTDDKRIECREFLDDELVLIASGSLFKDIKEKIDKKDLQNMPVIIREQGSGSRKTMEEIFQRHGIDIEDLNIVGEFGSTEAVKQAVKSGLGVSFVSSLAVKTEIQNEALKAISIKDFNITRHFYIITDRTRALSPVCESFIKSLSIHL